jgi:hypothetical protein
MGSDSGCDPTHEVTEAHDRVGNPARRLVDDQVVGLTDVLSVSAIDLGAMDVLARDQ